MAKLNCIATPYLNTTNYWSYECSGISKAGNNNKKWNNQVKLFIEARTLPGATIVGVPYWEKWSKCILSKAILRTKEREENWPYIQTLKCIEKNDSINCFYFHLSHSNIINSEIDIYWNIQILGLCKSILLRVNIPLTF